MKKTIITLFVVGLGVSMLFAAEPPAAPVTAAPVVSETPKAEKTVKPKIKKRRITKTAETNKDMNREPVTK